jgi:hypothetical protein
MLNISSLFNPLNWLKFIFNPNKGINVFLKIISDYPRIQKLLKIRNKLLRKLIINFYTFFVRKNKSLNFFFLQTNNPINQISFDLVDLKQNRKILFESLAYNGIVFIKNALPENERKKILSYFIEIEKNKLNSNWIDNKIINASNIKYNDSNEIDIKFARKQLKDLPDLESISNHISSSVFGDNVQSEAGFFLHNSKKRESYESFHDTIFHIDRYLPCLKVIYSPDAINHNHGPFGFIKSSHKINNENIKEYLLNSTKDYIDENQISNLIKTKAIKATCESNTLIIAFTNGLHKRNIFLEDGILRKTIFLQYTESFNKLSLLNFFKYNSKVKTFIKV